MHAVHLLGGASRGAVGRSAKRAGGRAFQSILPHDDAHYLGFRNSHQKRRYWVCQRRTRFHRSTSVIATSPSPSYRRDGRDDGITPRRCLSSSSSSSTRYASANGSNDNADATTTTSSRWTRVLLPTIGQNGTLVIRSNDNSVAQVQIVSQWRDDALLEVFPMQNNNSDDDDDADAERRRCAGSNADGEDTDIFEIDDKASESSRTTQTFGRLQLTSHAEGISTSMGRKGSLVEVDIILPTTPHQSQSNTTTNSHNDNKPMLKIIATVPEKCNITCQLSHDGDIDIPGKLEGDIHLATCNGNITVSKLRGHNVTLDTTSKANESMMVNNRDDAIDNSSTGVIHVRKAIEAGTVKINTSSRVRARMLNGSNVSVNVTPPDAAPPIATTTTSSANESDAPKTFVKLDDDDEGAVIDVGSLYVSNGSADGSSPDNENEARLEVHGGGNFIASRGDDDRVGLVRVKSSHGHVTVRAETNGRIITPDSSPRKSSLDDERIMMAPLVDLGGVNGSCDINLEPHFTENGPSVIGCNDSMAARVHFDSMTPESISTITSRGRVGNASITMDRKLEADIRLLSVANSRAMLPADVDAYALTSDEAEDVRSALLDVDADVVKESAASSEKVGDGEEAIAIETDAYRGERGLNALSSNGESNEENYEGTMLSPDIEYAQGTMKNRSGEPDSRFDVRSRGKINIAGAASQALHGFQGKEKENDPSSSSAPPMPLLAVATDGKIKLETLSWFGSIARRYGLEEEEGGGGGGLGRQASRAPRLDK